nr:MAG TPA: hypothetical protein [Caudoviricetes sp.]
MRLKFQDLCLCIRHLSSIETLSAWKNRHQPQFEMVNFQALCTVLHKHYKNS